MMTAQPVIPADSDAARLARIRQASTASGGSTICPDTLFAAPMPYLPRRKSNAGSMECEKCGLVQRPVRPHRDLARDAIEPTGGNHQAHRRAIGKERESHEFRLALNGHVGDEVFLGREHHRLLGVGRDGATTQARVCFAGHGKDLLHGAGNALNRADQMRDRALLQCAADHEIAVEGEPDYAAIDLGDGTDPGKVDFRNAERFDRPHGTHERHDAPPAFHQPFWERSFWERYCAKLSKKVEPLRACSTRKGVHKFATSGCRNHVLAFLTNISYRESMVRRSKRCRP